ncbi:MAG: carboxymethylenebutenolidase [Pseudonocardiales bacterium]|jgi:carboxymethylenebutenolidase|uniref:dienelactone hydrolase family protein n=1 Tax=Pseudonocardia sp. Cha107L01 TaxID=3457576 RepID=UPI0028C99C03|nr:dienelactone hydrolase family protein [Pseudonocardia sp.]MDT7558328.1 carboxymethylenebutenolidase [Pseudonocardiales bacterium]MDT7563875.1 carboxymethylenebutenolidase [Pseudonocardiales bacterium]MDT7589222.1 carboxymethylenebutenolidase [Pseudonocardiales bacterium]MDT7594335.1 carboxymethylenebutenolidase [Pseudonocardiales bacterium]
MQSDVTFRCDDGFAMPGVLTTPDGQPDAPRPGLLLIYEIFGMNDEMTRVAADLAGEGWTVLIPDLFARGSKPLCVARCLRTVATGKGDALDDLDAARRYLTALPSVDPERVGVIGFCMGGGFALLLAMTGNYQASAPFYGMAPKEMPRSCPVVGSYGAKDLSLKPMPARLERNLTELGVPHDVKVYPEVGHSFYTKAPNRVMELVGPYTPLRLGHHEPSAQDARERVVAFFREHLDG